MLYFLIQDPNRQLVQYGHMICHYTQEMVSTFLPEKMQYLPLWYTGDSLAEKKT